MRDIPLQCQCGLVQGIAAQISPKTCNHVLCYCKDCQMFATHLNKAHLVLDEWGGTNIVQVFPTQIKITQGADLLRAVQLSSKGLIRWYSDCCKTPVANTVSNSVPFLGLIHTFIKDMDSASCEIGPVRFSIFGKYANGSPSGSVHPAIPLRMLGLIIPRILWAKIHGLNQPSPFFLRSGEPVSSPQVLDKGTRF